MKKIPYGISDYELLISDNYFYVDKTMYLEKLENAGYTLKFLRPRRFGKTLFTSMMQYYYYINSKDKFDTLFKDTYVYNNPTINKNNYYVFRLDFSGLNGNYDQLLKNKFKEKVISAIDEFNKYYNFNIIAEGLEPDDVLLKFIREFNKLNLNNKLYIIIDEYDNFTNSILEDGVDRFKTIFTKFCSTL